MPAQPDSSASGFLSLRYSWRSETKALRASAPFRNNFPSRLLKVNLDVFQARTHFHFMTVLELKQEASRLKPSELKELRAYLMRLSRSTPAWRKAMSKKLTAVSAGKFITSEQMEAKIRGE
jgi:hypothetical protein